MTLSTIDRRGMTTLEVLCATTLATLLMAAVLGVVSGLTRHEKTLRHRDPQPAWLGQLAAQLRRDFSRADRVAFGQDRVLLQGSLGDDPALGTANWLAAEVEYRLVPSDWRRDKRDEAGLTLLRIERSSPVRSTDQKTEIVCTGAERLVVLSIDPSLSDVQAQPALIATDLEAGFLPRSVWVGLWTSEKDSPVLALNLLRP